MMRRIALAALFALVSTRNGWAAQFDCKQLSCYPTIAAFHPTPPPTNCPLEHDGVSFICAPTATPSPTPQATPTSIIPKLLTEDVDCDGTANYVETTTLIPAGVQEFAITTEVLADLVPFTSYSVGVASFTSLWGSALTGSAGSTSGYGNFVGRGPTIFPRHVAVRLTFPTIMTSCQIRVSLWYADLL